jgi:1,4-alpha-glucan branching enzyme
MEAAIVSRFTADDLHLFGEGTHYRLYRLLGAHPARVGGREGTWFAVWAPGARAISVVGSFNGWDRKRDSLVPLGNSGIWERFVPGAREGDCYKYHVRSAHGGYRADKADPFAFSSELPPQTGSVVWKLGYPWQDDAWMRGRGLRNALAAPISIYEVHLGSWRRDPQAPDRLLGYRGIAPQLADYAAEMGFTHVELLPVMEHPFYGSWGYQVTGYFAATSRYGTPQDLMFLVDTLHKRGIGVILDWVPSHFPRDEHGLGFYDGAHLYEHADPRQGVHPDWGSFVFNYGRSEIPAFLISSALFWLDLFHADGLRVDAVASMLYLDYSRKEGEWVPNAFGGRENLDASSFLRRLNETVYREYPDVQTFAEESTAWPMVSRPTTMGGLGFGLKWDMGWMHDALKYMAEDPVHRKYHHNLLTFRLLYAFHENFVLPLSHDEVVHGKGSLLERMPGDDWQKFANLRLLLGYMMAQPGKKLLFMGGEFGQRREWNHDESLDWHLLQLPGHQGVERWVRDLNCVYREVPSLHQRDHSPDGFAWIDCNDADASIVSFARAGDEGVPDVLVVCNFTPVPRLDYRVGAPLSGHWREELNSDTKAYGGSGVGNQGDLLTDPVPFHGHVQSLRLSIPPLGMLLLRHHGGCEREEKRG